MLNRNLIRTSLKKHLAIFSTFKLENLFINQFFNDGEVGKIGTLFEANISNTLLRAGFFPWPSKNRFHKKISEIDPVNSRMHGEVDCIVSGDLSAWNKLSLLCPHGKIRLPNFRPNQAYLFLIEAKVSMNVLIKSLVKNSEKASNFAVSSSHNCLIDEKNWLLQPSLTQHEHKVVFVNGGEESKNWVVNGQNSLIFSEKLVWEKLAQNNVSVFYCESFSQEWVINVTKNLKIVNEEFKVLNEEFKVVNEELTDTKKKLQLLTEKIDTLINEKK
jgi:hypothetical protein